MGSEQCGGSLLLQEGVSVCLRVEVGVGARERSKRGLSFKNMCERESINCAETKIERGFA